jgi:hypothetical protein
MAVAGAVHAIAVNVDRSTRMFTKTTRSVLVAIAAGLAVAPLSALPASGQGPTRTLTFTTTQKSGDEQFIDLKPSGESPGDRFTVSSTIHMSGRKAGRVEAECVALDRRYAVFSCSGVILLPGGSITFDGASADKTLPGGVRVKRPIYAITGGTDLLRRARNCDSHRNRQGRQVRARVDRVDARRAMNEGERPRAAPLPAPPPG